MGETKWLWVKNWGEYQHYQDGRSLKWIKNYISLDDPSSKFSRLSFSDQGKLQAIWRLAAKLDDDGLLPFDERFIARSIGARSLQLGSIVAAGWLLVCTTMERDYIKTAAKQGVLSRVSYQDGTLYIKEVRSKNKKPPNPLSDNNLSCVECKLPFLTYERLSEHLENVHGVAPLRGVA